MRSTRDTTVTWKLDIGCVLVKGALDSYSLQRQRLIYGSGHRINLLVVSGHTKPYETS
jgi:hypothetical protein